MKDLSLTQIFNQLRGHYFTFLTVTFVLSCCYSLLLGSALVFKNVSQISQSWNDQVEVVSYLEADLSEVEMNEIIEKALKNEAIVNAKVIDKNYAWSSFRQDVEDLLPSSFFDEVSTPFPSSIEFKLSDRFLDQVDHRQLLTLKADLLKMKGITDIVLNIEWLNEIQKTRWIGRVLGISFFSSFAIGSFILVGLMTRQLLYNRRKEIELLELVGATKDYIRTPFIIEGALVGLLSSFTAISCIYLLSSLQNMVLTSELGFLGLPTLLSPPNLFETMIALFAGSVLSAMAAYASVRAANQSIMAES